MIDARQLTKRFGGRTAIEGVSLQVARGEVVGFLGPNGAGKSTTFRILAGVFPPDAGTVTIDGLDLEHAPLAARRRIGYVPERPGLHHERTVEDELDFIAALRGVAAAGRRRTVEDAMERVRVTDVRRRRIGALSRGTRQRVSVSAALVGDPPVLLLDEPTAGLDPAQSAETRRLIGELGRERAVLVSSHVLSDLESLCGRVVVLHQGRVLADGAPDALAPRLRRTRWVDLDTAAAPARIAALLQDLPGVRRVEALPGDSGALRCRIEVTADRDVRAAIASALARAGIELYALVPVEPSLEEAFLSLVGEPPGEEAAS